MSDAVSRETPSAPAVARRVFSDALPVAVAYAELLATEGVLGGRVGPRGGTPVWGGDRV